MRKHGGTPSWRDNCVTPAAIVPPGAARGRFVAGHQSGLAECKSPPLFKRGASSCSLQGRRQEEPTGPSARPSAPTYLPGGVQAESAHKPIRATTPARTRGLKVKTPTDTPTPHTPARICGVQAERAHKHTHSNISARNGGAQQKVATKHSHPHRTPQPGLEGYRRSAHTNTHTPTPQPGLAG